MEIKKNNWSNKFSLPLCAAGLICGLIYVFTPEGMSEEFLYTVKVISWFCFPLLCLGFLCNARVQKALIKSREYKYGWLVTACLGLAFCFIPIVAPSANEIFWIWGILFSLCWLFGFLFLAIALFLLAIRLNNWASSLVCLLASIFVAFFLGEGYFLFSSQTQDGKYYDAGNSHYVKDGVATTEGIIRKTPDGAFPGQPDHPSASFAHRELKFNKLLYDVRYTFDKLGRRITPEANSHPQGDILVFGCSFTFGHGLENEQTWAWKLGKLLGPNWHVANYGYNAFGPQQMLNMIESGHVEMPEAPFRHAFFLGINHQLHRFTGLFFRDSSWYAKENGQVIRKGLVSDSPWYLLTSMPRKLNGSQFAENAYYIISGYVRQQKLKEFSEVYIWILKQSAKLLEEKYQTPLTVLLWPDLDWLTPDLEAAGINFIHLRPFLKHWPEKGEFYYQIVPHIETHPNNEATTEIAEGLAFWLASQPGAPVETVFSGKNNK